MFLNRTFLPIVVLLVLGFLASQGVSAQNQRSEPQRSYPGRQANEELNLPTAPPTSCLGTESTTSLWTFDFSGSAGLSTLGDANGGARWKVVSALEPNLIGQNFGPTFNSTSGGSFALINSDSFPSDTQDDYLILKVGASLVGLSGVQLSFRHYFRRFAEDHVVEVSNDSLSWVSFYSSASLIARNTTINNSTLTRLNISSVAANQPQIWIRFRYVGAWDWFWALDDIEIANIPPNDLILEDWDISPKVGLCFNAQMARVHLQDSLIFSGAVYNYGENTQPNVRLNARAFQGASPLYNNNSPAVVGMSSNSRDTLESRPYLAMVNLPVGNYTLRIEALSDSTDGSPSNNVDTTLLMITEDRISPFYPASTSLGTLGTSSFTGNEDGVIVTSLVNLSVQDTVTGIRVYLRSNTVPGGLIAVSMRDTDGIEGSPAIEFPVLVESDSITVTAADVARGYMDIPIPAILAGVPQERILPAGPYYAAAQLFSNSASSHIRIPDDLSNEAFMPWYASMVYLPTDGWYSNGIAMGIAALFAQNSQPCTTSIPNNINISGCGFAVLSSGDTVNQSGTYIDTLLNSMGCDSILNQLVTIQNPSICNPIPSYVPTNGLVGWWGFNGNAQDGSGNGNHGTVNGATLTTDRFGLIANAYYLNGVSDYLSVPVLNNSLLPQNLTVSTWCQIPSNYTANNHIGMMVRSRFFGYILLYDDNNQSIRFETFTNGTATPTGCTSYGTDYSDNVWHHIVGTFDGSINKLYIDGNLISSIISTHPISYSSDGIIAFGRDGNNPSLSTALYQGKLDDIGIWNRALTQQEITNLYNSQLPTQISLCLPTITTNTPTSIGIDSVVIGGDILNDGGSTIVLRGVCYSTTPNPNMGNPRTKEGSGIGSFTSTLKNLSPSTTYYARSYAKNSQGVVVYGNEVSFALPNSNQSILKNTFTVVQNNTCILDTGQWIYIAYTKNANNEAKLYKNGVLQATGNYMSLNYSWNRIDIGAEFYTSYCCWYKGRLDEVRISNSVRTSTEISTHFNSNSPFTQDANTIGLYHFDEGSGSTANGIVGPSGSLTNCQWTQGKFGSSLYYNGQNARTQINLSVPTSNYTMEFWVYIPNFQNSRVISTYGINTNSFGLDTNTVQAFTCGTSTVSDIDGNSYNTIQIGTQCWTQSNLKVSKYRNGDAIPTGLSNTVWANATSGAYAIYDNNPVNDGLYGKLYNHYAVMDTRGLCPTGWHVPTDGEWTILENHLGGSSVAGGALKSTATLPTPGGWASPNTGATNSSGFTAGPGGIRNYAGADFNSVGIYGSWWSSSLDGTNAWPRFLYFNSINFSRFSEFRNYGYSIRCLRD